MKRDISSFLDTKLINDSEWEEYQRLKEENEKLREQINNMHTLIEWCEECGFGFDNFRDDCIVDWDKFEEESEDMEYIESMIYYAEKYNKMQEIEEKNK